MFVRALLMGMVIVSVAGCFAAPTFESPLATPPSKSPLTTPPSTATPLATSPLIGVAESSVGKGLGVVLDETLRVVEVMSGGAADAAGILVGDILLDAAWIPDAPPELVPTPTPLPPLVVTVPAGMTVVDTDGRVVSAGEALTLPAPIPAPTLPPEQYIELGTVPFSDRARIMNLIPYGVPIKVRLQRGGEILELIVVPTTLAYQPRASGSATPTPLPATFYFY